MRAKAATITPAITLFNSAAPLRTNTNGEITSQMPTIKVSQLHPGWSRLQRTKESPATSAPAMRFPQIAFGDSILRTNGERRIQTPSKVFSQLLPCLFHKDELVRCSFIFWALFMSEFAGMLHL